MSSSDYWTFNRYIGANVGIGLGSVALTFLVMLLLIRFFNNLFYLIVEKIFGIKRYYLDIKVNSEAKQKTQILNLYGKHIDLADRSRINRYMLFIITTTAISAVLIVFFDGCLLAAVSIYPNTTCPYFGTMDCFVYQSDDNSPSVKFECSSGNLANFSDSSAWCYRWIALDQTTTSIVNQIGICTGLLTAYGAFLQIFFQLLVPIFREHKGIASGMRRIAEPIGINAYRRIRFNPFQKFEHPKWVIAFFILYILFTGAVIGAIVLLSKFKKSISVLTYIILASLSIISYFSVLLAAVEDPIQARGDDDKSVTVCQIPDEVKSSSEKKIDKQLNSNKIAPILNALGFKKDNSS
ncbi:unnamed protein product [Didymodactylos carnosus]|uniref:Uncharacterized protein n=1 Tax=Didymodactylos carnosus TaxID=1234261 RepID=A0A814VTF5_9BILA|nr:unnamed protein product [Didymodactylos carnosus]CAF3957504.1 unnamed protein product [Didymodactylos carnosus]